jgi:hypothetical protein
MKLTGESRSTRGEACPSATFFTTNPTWTYPGSNPVIRGERLDGTALMQHLSMINCFTAVTKYEYRFI